MSLSESLLTLGSIALIQLLAVISPGPSFLIVARTAVAGSRGQGVTLAAGLALGTVVWSLGALVGLTSLFKAVPMAFTVMKVLGALFLLWIAFQTFRHARHPLDLEMAPTRGRQHPFLKGFLTQISNPKVAVFFGSIFIALLPPSSPLWMQIALVVIVSLNEFWWYSAVSFFCGSGPLRSLYLRGKTAIDRLTGLFLGALGVKLLTDA